MSVKDYFSNVIRRAATWIVQRGEGGNNTPVVITPLILQPGESDDAVQVFDLKSHVVPDNTIVRTDASSGDPMYSARYNHGLWHIAWSDGRLGVDPNTQLELIRAQAALTRQTRLARVDADLATARAVEKAREEDHNRARTTWDDAHKEHTIVVEQQRHDPGAFTPWLTVLYIFFALCIIIADLPLSLVVGQALNMPTAITGDPADLRNILNNPSALWELLAVAVGIAALTVIFKLLIDRVHVNDDNEKSLGARIRATLRIGGLLVAAATAVVAFWTMGRIRAAIMTPGGKASLKDMELVFVALAILFPVVAAFCLSLARVCFQNAKRLALAKKGMKDAWKEHRKALQPYLDAQSDRIALEERRKLMDDASIDETFLRQLYMHAFERGWKVPETRHAEATLYERCEKLMHRTLARVDQLDR